MKTRFSTLSSLLIVVALLSSCSKDNNNLIKLSSPATITLHNEQTSQIDVTSPLTVNYSSENEFHAKVTSSGKITANYVGETIINLSNGKDSKSISVIVEPRYNLYPSPCTDWGVTKNEVIAMYGTPDYENDNGIGYSNYSTSAPVAMFVFDDNGKLASSAAMVKTSYSSNLTDYLLERYMPAVVDAEEYTAMFINALTAEETTTAILLAVYNLSYFQVFYTDARVVATRSTKAIDNSNIKRLQEIADEMISNQ